jgi:dihydrofolate reductase
VGELAPSHSKAFVIGGSQLFAEALPVAELMHLTLIGHEFEGDVFFPAYDASQWRELSREKRLSSEGWAYEFVDLARA